MGLGLTVPLETPDIQTEVLLPPQTSRIRPEPRLLMTSQPSPTMVLKNAPHRSEELPSIHDPPRLVD